jgi:hypothetical protein
VIRSRVAVLAGVLAVSSTLSAARAVEQPLFSDAVVISVCVNMSPPVPIALGTGTFYGPVACNPPSNVLPTVCGIVSDPDLPAVEAPYDCGWGLSFSGTYTNILYGQFSAAGQMQLPEADGVYDLKFLVAFVANQAVLVGNAPTDDGWDVFTGPVDIVPTTPLVPPFPVAQYRFTMALTAVDSPVPAPIGDSPVPVPLP